MTQIRRILRLGSTIALAIPAIYLFAELASVPSPERRPAHDRPAKEPVSEHTLSLLRAKRDAARSWAMTCPDGTQSHNECPFGDMAIFSGMGCLSGEAERCEDVRKSQGSDGRFWRSPGLIGDDTRTNTFSRDQAKGVLAYLVATKNVEAALRWQAYIESNDGRLCPKTSDNRCVITAGTGRVFGKVWEYLGLKPAPWMQRGEWIGTLSESVQAWLMPHNFPMHLTMLDAYVQKEVERRGGPQPERAAAKVIRIINQREKRNPFFKLLRDGPTQEVADLILEKCPDTKPDPAVVQPEWGRHDWAWQRGEKDRAWEVASGHDCIFIVNMFERELEFVPPSNGEN